MYLLLRLLSSFTSTGQQQADWFLHLSRLLLCMLLTDYGYFCVLSDWLWMFHLVSDTMIPGWLIASESIIIVAGDWLLLPVFCVLSDWLWMCHLVSDHDTGWLIPSESNNIVALRDWLLLLYFVCFLTDYVWFTWSWYMNMIPGRLILCESSIIAIFGVFSDWFWMF